MLKRMQPADGRTVPDLDGKPIIGTIVIDTSATYWKRRIAAGDLVNVLKIKQKKEGEIK